jgi:hypothetical protein
MAALMFPRSAAARGACIPDGNAGVSVAQTAYSRSTLALAAPTGIIIGVNPSSVNDSSSLWWAYGNPGDTFDSLSPVTIPTRGPLFDTASLGSGSLEQRLVGAGLQITNLGAPLYAQGQIVAYQSFQDETFPGTATLGDYSSASSLKYYSMIESHKHPYEDVFHGYNQDTGLASPWQATQRAYGAGTYTGGAPVTAWVIYVPPDAQGNVNIHLDLISHFEYRGRLATLAGEPQPADQPWYTRIMGSFTSAIRGAGSLALNETNMRRIISAANTAHYLQQSFNHLNGRLLMGGAQVAMRHITM